MKYQTGLPKRVSVQRRKGLQSKVSGGQYSQSSGVDGHLVIYSQPGLAWGPQRQSESLRPRWSNKREWDAHQLDENFRARAQWQQQQQQQERTKQAMKVPHPKPRGRAASPSDGATAKTAIRRHRSLEHPPLGISQSCALYWLTEAGRAAGQTDDSIHPRERGQTGKLLWTSPVRSIKAPATWRKKWHRRLLHFLLVGIWAAGY